MTPTPSVVLGRIDAALKIMVAGGHITAAQVPATFWKACDRAVERVIASGRSLTFAVALDQVADELDAAIERRTRR